MTAKPRIIFAVFILVLASLLLFYYCPWIFKQKSFYLGDIGNFYEPYCNFFAENFRQGRLPLWNPYPECGLPQIGLTSPSVFYFPNLIFALVTFSQGLALSLIVHQLLAGIGGYLLVVRLGWGRLAGAVCGGILALNGYMFGLSNIYPLVETAAWIPVCLWSLINISDRFNGKNMLYVLLSSIFISMLVMSGRPELFGPAFVIFAGAIFAASVYRSKYSRWHSALCELSWRLASLAFGTLIAAPMILPAIEWAGLSPRAAGYPLHLALWWSGNFYDLLAVVLQHPFGNIFYLDNPLIKLTGVPADHMPLLAGAYVGPVAITLAIFALVESKWNWKWPLAGVLLLSLALSLGAHTPLMPWLFTTFPPLLALRYPVKLIYFVLLPLSLLAARGAMLLVRRSDSIRFPLIVSLGLWSLIFAGGILAVFEPDTLTSIFFVNYPDLSRQAIVGIGTGGINAAILAMVFLLIAILFPRWHLSRNLTACLVFLCLAAPMLYDACCFDRFLAEADFFERPSYLKDQLLSLALMRGEKTVPRVAQLTMEPLAIPPVFAPRTKGPDAWAAGSALYERQLLEKASAIAYQVPTLITYEGPLLHDYDALSDDVRQWSPQCNSAKQPKTEIPVARFCQMASVEYATTQIEYNKSNLRLLDPHFFKLVIECKLLNARIYQVINPLPRAYFSSQWTWLPHQAVMESIANAQTSHFDPAALTLLEHSAQAASDPIATGSTGTASANVVAAEFLSMEPDKVSLQIRAPQAGILVLTDQYYPGWQAFVDNAPTTIYRANAVMKSVFLKPGLHVVEFRFAPRSVNTGVILTAAAIIVLLLLFLLGNRHEQIGQENVTREQESIDDRKE